MQFDATALSDKFPRGRKSGHLEIINSHLCFIDEGDTVIGFPLMGVQISQGGTGNRYVYFTHSAYPDFTLYTDDKTILNQPDIKYDQNLLSASNKIKNNRRSLWLTVGGFFTLIVAVVLSLYIFRGQIVEHVASLFSPQKEQEMTSGLKAEALEGKVIINDSSLQKRLEMITTPLVNAVDNKQFKFSFTIIEDETLNAYALPGGTVIIHSGLIEKANSAEEVAGVLAHEISHVTRRHHIRGIISNMGMFIIVRGLLGDITGISSELATAGATLGSLKYSRDYEREADNSGWDLLTKANIDPHGMILFFEKMKKEEGSITMSDFISTHPGTEERIKNLKNKKIEDKTYLAFSFDFNDFKSDIKKYLKK